jgi:hypothetical protein
MGDLAVLVPSRGRPGAVAELAERVADTVRGRTALIVMVDVCDPYAAEYPSVAAAASGMAGLLAVEATHSAAQALNLAARRYAPGVRNLAYLPDWARPQLPGWDLVLVEALEAGHGLACGAREYGAVWERVSPHPRHVAMRAQVVTALGYMVPPGLDTRRWPQVWDRWAGRTGGMGGADRGLFVRDPLVAGRRAGRPVERDDYETSGACERDLQTLQALTAGWGGAG